LLVFRPWRWEWVTVVVVSVSLDVPAELPEADRSPLDPGESLDVSVPGPGWLPVSPGSLALLPTLAPDDCADAAPLASIPDSSRAVMVLFMRFLPFVHW